MTPAPVGAARALEALKLAEEMKPLLAGRHPAVQGAVLAQLTAIWLAGHPADAREALLNNQVDTINTLVPLEDILRAGVRH